MFSILAPPPPFESGFSSLIPNHEPRAPANRISHVSNSCVLGSSRWTVLGTGSGL